MAGKPEPIPGWTSAGPALGEPPARVSVTLDQLADLERVPLRLKVSRGGLGIELCEPLRLGPAEIADLEWALPELRYPLDLSGGVKEFVHHRGQLQALGITLRLQELSALVAEVADGLLGARPEVRLRAFQIESDLEVSVNLWTAESALAFDLVLGSTLSPRFVVDQARGVGLSAPPLVIGLGLLDGLAHRLGGRGIPLLRRGRSLWITEGVLALLVDLLPALGCRIPQHRGLSLQYAGVERGDLHLRLGNDAEVASVGRRGLRLAGLSDALETADDLLAGGNFDSARRAYLEALEASPGCPEVLFELARLEALLSDHVESARGYLDDAQERLARAHGPAEAPLAELPSTALALCAAFEGELLARAGQFETAAVRLRRAAELEPEPALSGFLFFRAAAWGRAGSVDLELIDLALSRAPGLVAARWARIVALVRKESLERASLDVAARDVERLYALESNHAKRLEILLRAADLFLRAGALDLALHFSKAAMALDGREPRVLWARAQALRQAGETPRALELLRSAHQKLSNLSTESLTIPADIYALHDQVSVLLAEVVVDYTRDYSEALRLVRGVDSRSAQALHARRLECGYARALSDERARIRALEKALEAFELGMLPGPADDVSSALAFLEELERLEGPRAPAGTLERLAAAREALSRAKEEPATR